MKRIFLSITLAALAFMSFAQDGQDYQISDYVPGSETTYSNNYQPYLNQGYNMMLEAEGTSNTNVAYGGVSITWGWQINPYFYIGAGQKLHFGSAARSWINNRANKQSNYFVDNHGNRFFSHGYDANGKELFFDYVETLMHTLDENGYTVPPVIYDENGNVTTDYHHYGDDMSDYYDNERDYGHGFGRVITYICFKANWLGNKRYTPYTDFRLGANIFRETELAKHCLDLNLMMGCRFGLGIGDRALNVSAGYAVADFTGFDDSTILGKEQSFMIRVGVEF